MSELTNVFTDIADAIRSKTGSSATITPAQMATEIENIPSGGGEVDPVLLYKWDFTKSLVDEINGVNFVIQKGITQNENGLNFTKMDSYGYIDHPLYVDNKIIEIDVVSYNASGYGTGTNNNVSFIMNTTNNSSGKSGYYNTGILRYKQGTGWGYYLNTSDSSQNREWGLWGLTDIDAISGKTIRIQCEDRNKMTLWLNNTLINTVQGNTYHSRPEQSGTLYGTSLFTLGGIDSTNADGNYFYEAIISGLRIYNIPLIDKDITDNGIYNASADYVVGYKKVNVNVDYPKAHKKLYEWDFTKSLVDKIQKQEAIPSGANKDTIVRDNTGIHFNNAYQSLYLCQQKLDNVIIEVDISSFDFKGNSSNNTSILSNSWTLLNDTREEQLLYYKPGSSYGWCTYASGSRQVLSKDSRDVINNSTLKFILTNDRDVNKLKYYLNEDLIADKDNVIFQSEFLYLGGYNQKSGSDFDGNCYDMTITGVRIYENSFLLDEKTITENGTYNALEDDNVNGYSQVTVNVSGGGGPMMYDTPAKYHQIYSASDISREYTGDFT